LDEALALLDDMRVRHGDSPVYHYAIGSILQEKSDFPAAVAAYEEALEMLEDFRREAEEEDWDEELSVDFPAAGEFISRALESAKRERPFEGDRPLDLSGFQVEIEL